MQILLGKSSKQTQTGAELKEIEENHAGEGDIVEQGNHEELLAKNGFYAGLYQSQFEEIA